MKYILKSFLLLLFLLNVCGCVAVSVFENNATISSEYSATAKSSTTNTIKEVNNDVLTILDNGSFKKGKDYIHYSLKDFLLLLKKKNIQINQISGASNVYLNDAGNVRFDDTKWDYDFSKKLTSFYDVVNLDRLIQKQEIEAIYVKTKYETYVFRQSFEEEGSIQPIQDFDSDIIITKNPQFVTERNVKIGDSFEKVAKLYGFDMKDIIKATDYDWFVWVAKYSIMFSGTKSGIDTIGLGYEEACVE